MSSYLLAFVVSDFDYVSNEETKLPNETLHRVWVRPDSVSRARFAVESSEAVLKALEEYVGFPYELPKVDSAAIPNKGGAMASYDTETNINVINLFLHSIRKTGAWLPTGKFLIMEGLILSST